MIRRLTAADFDQWAMLYAGYGAFYKVAQTPEMRERVWGWIHDPAHPLTALVATDDAGALTGIAHYRPYPRPLSATTAGFLDDLFVNPTLRGRGIARALIEAISAEGRDKGWSSIRWLTAPDNATARALYDQMATATPWVTYEIKL